MRKTIEYATAWVSAFFALMFAAWTLACHAATFLNISWAALSGWAIGLLLPLGCVAALPASRFAERYCSDLERPATPPGTLNLYGVSILLLATAALFLPLSYTHKFLLVCTAIGAIACLLVRKTPAEICPLTEPVRYHSAVIEWMVLAALIGIATIFALCSNRPDLDDCSFLQLAAQTLNHPGRPPLSFDAALGQIIPALRFAPYRIASYELLVAWIAEWSGLELSSVYYLLMPGLCSGLGMVVAFVFVRPFFSSRRVALLATTVFLLLMFAWGETHIAYGNRVFVRLFQGKGLIIALTTPFAITVGLMMIRSPAPLLVMVLFVVNICAVGVSSSGLVMTVFTGLIICAASVTRDLRKTVLACLSVGVTLAYPAALALWLATQKKSGISLSEVGTYLPINASLGLHVRESAALAALLLCFAVFHAQRDNVRRLLVGCVVGVILNPWFSFLIATITSRNMSWRLAWAAPVPLLVSIGLVAGLRVDDHGPIFPVKKRALAVGLLSVCPLSLFLFSPGWVVSPANHVVWGYPAAKLPAEYHAARKIAAKIRHVRPHGTVLAHMDIAAWLPLALPDVGLVMPGHMYHIQFQTILPQSDHEARMQLFQAACSHSPDFGARVKALHAYNVRWVVLPEGVEPLEGTEAGCATNTRVRFDKLDSIAGYSLFRVYYGNTND